MRRSKKAYENYVCPYCFNMINKCTCDFYPPYTVIFIDKGVQECIRLLNNKGYKTIGCCEGHYKERCISTYVAFNREYGFDGAIDIPNGFKYNKNRRTIYFDYSQKLSKDEMEQLKKEKLESLLIWCINLNSIKG